VPQATTPLVEIHHIRSEPFYGDRRQCNNAECDKPYDQLRGRGACQVKVEAATIFASGETGPERGFLRFEGRVKTVAEKGEGEVAGSMPIAVAATKVGTPMPHRAGTTLTSQNGNIGVIRRKGR
jgi:hypothetical protein